MSWLSDAGAAILRFADAYTIRARLFPAILGAAPALATLLLLVSWKSFELSNIVATLGALVLIYALADCARKAGKDIEPRIYREMGGKPSTTMMRRADGAIKPGSKGRYRTFLAQKLNRPEPTAQLERRNLPTSSTSWPVPGCERTRATPRRSRSYSTSW